MLNTLKPSARSCSCLDSPNGMFLKSETSMLTACELLSPFRPKFPNPPTGESNAQVLNHDAAVKTASAALPPWEIVFWQAGSGFAPTGPAVNGSAIRFGLPYPVSAPKLTPDMLAGSPLTFKLNGWPERAWKI